MKREAEARFTDVLDENKKLKAQADHLSREARDFIRGVKDCSDASVRDSQNKAIEADTYRREAENTHMQCEIQLIR